MKNLIQFLAVITCVIGFVGCASTDGPAEKSPADQIKPGMTKEQVRQILGKPESRHSGLTGEADEMWLYSDGAMNLIPIYGLLRGARMNTTFISFKKGRVLTTGESSYGLW